MEITEIVLLAAGGIIFILSFFIPDKKGEASEQSKELVKEEIADMVSREMESVKGQVDGVVEEAVTYAMEKTERSLERLSNEKIMAVNEYSDTVLAEIHKNHEEAMFLYDMLNNKHDNLKNTVSEVNRTVKEVEEKLSSFQEMVSVPAALQPGSAEKTTGEYGAMQPLRLQQLQPAPVASAAPENTAIARLQTMARQASEGVNTAAASSDTVRTAGNKAASGPQTSVRQGASMQSSAVPPNRPAAPSNSGGAAGNAVSSVPQAAMQQTFMPMTVLGASVQPMTGQQAFTPADISAVGRVSFLQEKAGGQNNNERILELYRQGKSKVAIAKELGLGVGEVKLVIDLFRNQ